MAPVNIGVIGAGSIAKYHLETYAANPAARLVAVSDLNLDRARIVADHFGAPSAYRDPGELLADPEVDAVSICTWNNSHAQWATAAVEAGKHVLVEKPMSRTSAEAFAVADVAEGSDRVFQVGFVRRHSRGCQVLKTFIDNGDLGEIYFAKASYLRRAGNPGGWFADRAVSGGGPLIDIGIHVLDLCWYLMGSPRAIAVSANSYHRLGDRANLTAMGRYLVSENDVTKNSVEDMVNAVVRFENGASLLLDASYSLHTPRDSIAVSVHGDRGGAELEPRLTIATEKYDSVINIEPQLSSAEFVVEDAFAAEIANFIDTIEGRATSVAPAWHGAEIMRIIDGIYGSAAEGHELLL